MFGLQFLFAAGLWALPLAGVPILLHLLFRQKSPVVQFSTLRFIKLSIQKTAARRRVQKWLLLACRALLIALLIWAVAQPVKKLAGGWLGGGKSAVAAIVVDTSHSMALQDGPTTLLSKADGMVQDLLRGELARAKVAVFQSGAVAGRTEELTDAGTILAGWSPLKMQGNPKPLVDRVSAAVALLNRESADRKWLIVLSDFQANEFARPIPEVKDGHSILIDLHPTEARSAGVTRVRVTPEQPIPGIDSEAAVDVLGRPGDSRAVSLKISSVDGSVINQTSPMMANLDGAGRATVRFPLKLPAQHWVMLTAILTADDAMSWDNQRTELVEIPARRAVSVIANGSTAAARFIRLALDPSEGKSADWPVRVSVGNQLTGTPDAVVEILSKWPAVEEMRSVRDLARAGKNVVLFLQPGLENSWKDVPAAAQELMLELLPGTPRAGTVALRHVAIGNGQDPLLEGLMDEKFQLSAITLRQMVVMLPQEQTTAVLNAVAIDPSPGSRPTGFVFRKPVGSGFCFTVATSVDSSLTNFATHPTFLPLLVRMVLRKSNEAEKLNVELGGPLLLDGALFPEESQLQIRSPDGAEYRMSRVETSAGGRFVFSEATEPGIYSWKRIQEDAPIAMTNVQLPAGESDLNYRPGAALASGDAVVASNVMELQKELGKRNEPAPKWSMPIAIVLVLLCFEALMGSGVKIARWPGAGIVVPALSNMNA